MIPSAPDLMSPLRTLMPQLRPAAALALGALLLAAPRPLHAAARPDPRRLTREIGVMEKTIDEMLLDSSNLLVYSAKSNARGLYLDGYGVILSFSVSLVERSGGTFEYRFKDFKIEDTGDQIIIHKEKEPAGDGDSNPSAAPRRTKEADAAALKARQAEQYAAGKKEVVDVLLDYGTSMSLLRDDQRIAIAAYLRDADYFRDRHLSRLILSARVGDLRAFAAGRMTREEATRAISEEEY